MGVAPSASGARDLRQGTAGGGVAVGAEVVKSTPGTWSTRAISSSMSAASDSSGPTSGSRTRGLEMRPRPCRMYFAATVPGTWVMVARTSGSSAWCAAVAVARSLAFTASTMVRYGSGAMLAVTPMSPVPPIARVGSALASSPAEVEQVGLVEHPADLAEVAFGVFDGADVGVLRRAQDRLVLDLDAGAAGDVVEDHRQVGRVGDHAEVREDAGLRRLVVVRRDDHDAVGAGLLAVLVQLDGVRGLVGPAAGDDLGAAVGDLLGDLDELDLLGVGEGAGLAGRAGDDDAVGAVR